jgi:hypothetical protein
MATERVFDESLIDAARALHLAPIALMATACAALVFVWIERRGRPRWRELGLRTTVLAGQPYRVGEIVSLHRSQAPRIVRLATFSSLAFLLTFAPLILEALRDYPFDGIAIPLVPGLALLLLDAWCAYMLLMRSPIGASAAHTGAVGSLMANVGLLGIAAAHFVVVELQRRDGIAHACSSSVTFVVIVFAVASVMQALLTMKAVRECAGLVAAR